MVTKFKEKDPSFTMTDLISCHIPFNNLYLNASNLCHKVESRSLTCVLLHIITTFPVPTFSITTLIIS